METRQELNLSYWGRVVPMCKGTALEGCEWECVKRGSDTISCHPSFITQDCDLAVAILEDSPIFVGDFIYDKHGSRYEVLPIDHSLLKGCVRISYESSERIDELVVPYNLFSEEYALVDNLERCIREYSLIRKRTFTLNGVELPSPIKKYLGQYSLNIGIDSFFFNTLDEKHQVIREISNILRSARDK